MSRMNVFIDGSWLFNACRANRALASRTEYPDNNFALDFGKLNAALLEHVKSESKVDSLILGDLVLSTSIFQVPAESKSWPEEFPEKCTAEGLERVKGGVFAREKYVNSALSKGYSDTAIFRPRLKPYIVRSLGDGNYQEKQVDATIVALVVKYAITRPDDYHILISGDKDMLPAIEVACPEFTVNVSVATTHPDGFTPEQSQSAYSLFNYNFAIRPFILDEPANAMKLLGFPHVYECSACRKFFGRPRPTPVGKRPICSPCHKRRPAAD
jgi:hypothetical protein